MLFDALVAGHMRRHGLRALVTVAAIALAVSVYLAVRLANAHAVAALAEQTGVFGDEADFEVTRPGRLLADALLARIRSASGIASALPIVDGALVVPPGEVLRIEGRDLLTPLPRAIEFRHELPGPFAPIGDGPSPVDLLARRAAIVSTVFAERHRLSIGARVGVRIGTRASSVLLAALFPRDVASIDADVAIVDIATARALFGRTGFDRIACTALAGEVDAARRSVTKLLPPDARIGSAAERRHEVERLLAGFSSNLGALGALALVLAGLVVYDAIAISVLRRGPEIGTLRALGTPRGDVARTFVVEGALLGSVGSLLGVAGGTVLATCAGAIPVPTDLYSLDRTAPLVAFAIGVALAVLAALAPARAAAALPPIVALSRGPLGRARANPRGISLGRSAACGFAVAGCAALATMLRVHRPAALGLVAGSAFVAAAACAMPTLVASTAPIFRARARRFSPTAELAMANLAASPTRVAASLTALSVSVALATAVVVFAFSFRASVDRFATEALRGDLVVTPLGGASAPEAARFPNALVARVAVLPGVARIEATQTTLVPYAGALVALRSSVANGARARASTGDAHALEADVDSEFAAFANVRAGDAIVVKIDGTSRRLHVRAVVDGDPLGAGTIELDARTSAIVLAHAEPNALTIGVRDGTDLSRLRSGIEATFGATAIDVRTTRDIRAELLRRIDAVAHETFALAGLGIVIGILGIATALTALVLERRDEIRLVRFAGLTRGGVRAMVIYEAAALGGLGGAAGVVLGLALAATLLATDRAVFGWILEPVVPPLVPFVALAGSVVVAVLAGLAPARLASRLPIARAGGTIGSLLLAFLFAGGATAARADEATARVVWRVLGHVETRDGARFDVAATFFRFVDATSSNVTIYASSLAVVDESIREKTTAVRVDRGDDGEAASGPHDFDVRVDDWNMRAERAPSRTRPAALDLQAGNDATSLDLRLVAATPRVQLGPGGLVRSGSCATCIVRDEAYPRLAARGVLRWKALRYAVAGTFWIDRESGGTQLARSDRGWDRFTFVLDDGRALLVRRVRGGPTGRNTVVLNGTYIARSGRATFLNSSEIAVENARLTTWRNVHGVAYPSLWELFVPKLRFDFAVVPDIQAQEFDAGIRGAHFYDGSVDVERAAPGPRDEGRGYVELTGYDEPLRF